VIEDKTDEDFMVVRSVSFCVEIRCQETTSGN
jgi:hypothetical protein